ncbi:unnamed protein product [Didymodactylos carnosus]|uniref:Mab-21-like nucleotidyltransferase domain-containing protein n=1 Tax=Didymodactylos carnosus TaxID=1234261 RepID=A0A815VLE0_9BILA|nr:unnamed protein product [Didymodactylos carnosus]CAF4397198.1 unnamed protein product [Didymodactylos carnosus]
MNRSNTSQNLPENYHRYYNSTIQSCLELFKRWLPDAKIFFYIYKFIGPAFNVPLTYEEKSKIIILLEFFRKWKHLAIESNKITYNVHKCIQKILPSRVDHDYVPAFKLNFWSTIIQENFLKRFEKSRPDLYEHIKTIHTHLVPKWSETKETLADQELEFRYSFSVVEIILAEKRSPNGLAS